MLTHNLKNKISNLLRKSMKGGMRGFTLLELVIVIAIIGILAVIVLPSMLSALSKARDAKKMTELRGAQTFLTVTGIDTSLRYPATTANLVSWYSSTNSRPPVELKSANAGIYKYQGIDCATGYAFRVGTLSVASTDTTCSSYQLWSELEQRAVALSLDADYVTISNSSCVSGSSANGPCVKSTLAANDPAQEGDSEACTSATAVDCVFDLIP